MPRRRPASIHHAAALRKLKLSSPSFSTPQDLRYMEPGPTSIVPDYTPPDLLTSHSNPDPKGKQRATTPSDEGLQREELITNTFSAILSEPPYSPADIHQTATNGTLKPAAYDIISAPNTAVEALVNEERRYKDLQLSDDSPLSELPSEYMSSVLDFLPESSSESEEEYVPEFWGSESSGDEITPVMRGKTRSQTRAQMEARVARTEEGRGNKRKAVAELRPRQPRARKRREIVEERGEEMNIRGVDGYNRDGGIIDMPQYHASRIPPVQGHLQAPEVSLPIVNRYGRDGDISFVVPEYHPSRTPPGFSHPQAQGLDIHEKDQSERDRDIIRRMHARYASRITPGFSHPQDQDRNIHGDTYDSDRLIASALNKQLDSLDTSPPVQSPPQSQDLDIHEEDRDKLDRNIMNMEEYHRKTPPVQSHPQSQAHDSLFESDADISHFDDTPIDNSTLKEFFEQAPRPRKDPYVPDIPSPVSLPSVYRNTSFRSSPTPSVSLNHMREETDEEQLIMPRVLDVTDFFPPTPPSPSALPHPKFTPRRPGGDPIPPIPLRHSLHLAQRAYNKLPRRHIPSQAEPLPPPPNPSAQYSSGEDIYPSTPDLYSAGPSATPSVAENPTIKPVKPASKSPKKPFPRRRANERINTVYVITGADGGVGTCLTATLLNKPCTTVVAIVRDKTSQMALSSVLSTLPKGPNSSFHILIISSYSKATAPQIWLNFWIFTGLEHVDALVCCPDPTPTHTSTPKSKPKTKSAPTDTPSIPQPLETILNPMILFTALKPKLLRSQLPPKFIIMISPPTHYCGFLTPRPTWALRSLHLELEVPRLVAVGVSPEWVGRRTWGESLRESVGGLMQVLDEVGCGGYRERYVCYDGRVLLM